MKKVLIIGAGPIGLFQAIEIARHDSTISIEIWEKRKTYSRKQIIIINNTNLGRLPRLVKSKLFGKKGLGCYVKPPPRDQVARCYITKGKRILGSIAINVMEQVLSEYIIKKLHNVTIITKNATNVLLRKALGNYNYIIGCDGKQSITRKFMGGSLKKYRTGYGMVLTFNTPKPDLSRPDKAVLGIQAGSTYNIPEHRFRAFRSRGKGYYLAVQLQKAEFKLLKGGHNLSSAPKYIQDLGREVAKYYGIKLPALRRVNLSTFPIETSISSFISRKVGKTRVTIIGDAFLGVNFFSGLGVNFGMDEAVTMAKVVTGKVSITALRKEMTSFARARKKALKTLTIPQNSNSWFKKCKKTPKKQRLQVGKAIGTDLQMLNSKNQCLVLSRARNLFNILGPGVSKGKILRSKKHSCKYGTLKRPVRTNRGRKRQCKKRSRAKSKSRRRKSLCSSRRCRYGKLKTPIKGRCCKKKPGRPKSR